MADNTFGFGANYFTPFQNTPVTPGGSPEAGGGPPPSVSPSPDPTVDLGSYTVTGQKPPPDPTMYDSLVGNEGNGGGFDLGSFLGSILGPNGSNLNSLFNGAGNLAGYFNNMKNSNQYMDLAGKYADQMNPFGSQRGYYQNILKQMYTDPNGYLANSPGYQAALKQGIEAQKNIIGANGFGGTGHGAMELSDYAGAKAAEWLNNDRNALLEASGANIGPGAAANLISHGIDASVQAKNNALANLTRALNPGAKGGSLTSGLGDIISSISRAFGGGGANAASSLVGVAQALMKQGMSKDEIQSLLGIDMSTTNPLATMEVPNGSIGLNPFTGMPMTYTNTNPVEMGPPAPPGLDGGGGGDNIDWGSYNIDPSLFGQWQP